MDKLVREVGNWVTGDRFYDRENEIADLIEILREGANILVTGQRRMGKTSLTREVGRRLEEEFLCIYLDVQKCESPADVIADICVAIRPHMRLWDKTKEAFRNIPSKVKENIDTIAVDELRISLRGDLSSSWEAKGERIIEELAKSERPVVVFCDEFPLFISRILKGSEGEMSVGRLHTTDIFTSWVRATTIRHRGKLRLVLTGSIGLEPVLRQAKMSGKINTFTPFELKPWDGKTAAGCLHALANNYGVHFEDETVKYMLELLGCYIPQHVQMFFSYLYDDCKHRNNMHCSPEDAHRLYYSSMLGIRGHAELSTYEERLSIVLGKEIMPLALELLTEAAITGKLTPQTANILGSYSGLTGQKLNDALREILSILEHDGYLRLEGDSHVFVSKLVRDWWKARFSYQFVSALNRKV